MLTGEPEKLNSVEDDLHQVFMVILARKFNEA